MCDKKTMILGTVALGGVGGVAYLLYKQQQMRRELIRLRTELAEPSEQRLPRSSIKEDGIFLPDETVVYLKPSHLAKVFGSRDVTSPLKSSPCGTLGKGVDLRFVDEDSKMLESVWRNGTTNKQFRQFRRS